MPAKYAWAITEDKLAEDGADQSDVGLMGPRDIDPALKARLENGEGLTFDLWDDDGIRYYRGRLVTRAGVEMDDDCCAAPLQDYGMPGAGCVRITWVNHPEWEIG